MAGREGSVARERGLGAGEGGIVTREGGVLGAGVGWGYMGHGEGDQAPGIKIPRPLWTIEFYLDIMPKFEI